jgi:hypothetical protein
LLNFLFSSPKHILDKAKRDLKALEDAISMQDKMLIGDSLFNFSVTVTSLKDWLKAHPSKAFTNQDVENFFEQSAALNSFKDIANAHKHREITRYVPATDDVSASAMPMHSYAMSLDTPPHFIESSEPRFKVKIVRGEARYEIVALGSQALDECAQFLQQHKV